MNDLRNETKLTVAQAAERHDKHVNTIHNWMNTGIRGVKLERYWVGGILYTSVEALDRFIDATQDE